MQPVKGKDGRYPTAAAVASRVLGMLGVQIFIYKRNHVYITAELLAAFANVYISFIIVN